MPYQPFDEHVRARHKLDLRSMHTILVHTIKYTIRHTACFLAFKYVRVAQDYILSFIFRNVSTLALCIYYYAWEMSLWHKNAQEVQKVNTVIIKG